MLIGGSGWQLFVYRPNRQSRAREDTHVWKTRKKHHKPAPIRATKSTRKVQLTLVVSETGTVRTAPAAAVVANSNLRTSQLQPDSEEGAELL
jgi:hypothetical protein